MSKRSFHVRKALSGPWLVVQVHHQALVKDPEPFDKSVPLLVDPNVVITENDPPLTKRLVHKPPSLFVASLNEVVRKEDRV
jgi:hypothetical protein